MRSAIAALLAAAAPAAGAGCAGYSSKKAYGWLDKQGCTDNKKNSCGGLAPDDGGCTDAAYIARALAAGGSVPLDPDSTDRDAYRSAVINGVSYNLEESEATGGKSGLKDLLKTLGWSNTGGSLDSAAFGAVVFTTAFAHSGGDGLPCFSLGGGRFDCHESPVLYGPQCDIGPSVFADPTANPPTDPKVWTCPGAPSEPAPPPAPTPAPPPACPPEECHPNSNYFVCQLKKGLSTADQQSVLDYCCSGVGPDCGKISQGGACFSPNTVEAHANWCVATYYRIQCPNCIVEVPKRCDFGGKAALVAGPIACPPAPSPVTNATRK